MLPEIQAWLSDPLTGKVVLVGVGIAAIVVAMRLLRQQVASHLHDNTARYQARKAVNFFGVLAALVIVALAFSDRLGGPH